MSFGVCHPERNEVESKDLRSVIAGDVNNMRRPFGFAQGDRDSECNDIDLEDLPNEYIVPNMETAVNKKCPRHEEFCFLNKWDMYILYNLPS